MNTNIQRRLFIKGSLAAGAVLGAGLISPRVFAAWPEEAFKAKALPDALKALLGTDQMTDSTEIEVKAPDIAENGAVVPVTISTALAGVESIAIVAVNNPVPLIASYKLGEGADAFVSTRIKMGKTGDVVAVVKVGDKVLVARKEVKVTIGGCGG